MEKFLNTLQFTLIGFSPIFGALSIIFDPEDGTKSFFGIAVFLLYLSIGLTVINFGLSQYYEK